jgi:hypothetical protein
MYLDPMPGFVRDVMASRKVRQSGLFNAPAMDRLIGDRYHDPKNYPTLCFALDLALAVENFG